MRLVTLTVSALLLLVGCQSSSPQDSSPAAEAVIDSAIAAHGGAVLDSAVVSFDFRGDHYRIRHENGRFHYRRTYTDSLDRGVVEGLMNEGTYRVVEKDTVSLSEQERSAVKTTVNSVSYFALLPEPLDDPAVQPEYHGQDTIDGTPYHRIQVTFDQEGGGDDWEDVFMYWFHTDTYAMDYLAYAFGLGPDDTEQGTRFRTAYNIRRINGVRMADYTNYTSDTLSYNQMHQYPELWAQNALDLVSRVELDSVHVEPLTETGS